MILRELKVPIGRYQNAIFRKLLASIDHPRIVLGGGPKDCHGLRLRKDNNSVWCEVAGRLKPADFTIKEPDFFLQFWRRSNGDEHLYP